MAKTSLEKYQTLAERYTKALLSSSSDKGLVERTGTELNETVLAFAQNPDIETFFTSPVIKPEDKKDVLKQAFENKINEELYNFLNLLIDKNRMFILPGVAELYHQKLAQAENILEVVAESVIALDGDMQEQIKQKLAAMTGKKIELTNKINTEILGGVILSFDGKTIDGSIKTQLKRLQKELI